MAWRMGNGALKISLAILVGCTGVMSAYAEQTSERLDGAIAKTEIEPLTEKALQLQPSCMRSYVEDFSEQFKSKSKMALPNCYTDPQDSTAIETLAKLLKAYPNEQLNIAKIVRSWTDNRHQCAVKQTAYAEAVEDVISYLEGKASIKEVSEGVYEGLCGAPNPYTTTCRTYSYGTVCTSGGGGRPTSRMECRYGQSTSQCTFTSDK